MFSAPSRVRSLWPRLSALARPAPQRGIGLKLYEAIVAQARSEPFYRLQGVPDTVHGRFEMIVLHVALVLARLEQEGAAGQATGRAMLEAFVADMDDACRRLGIGDMGVPRQVKKAAAAVLERGNAYRAAMVVRGAEGGDGDALAAALAAEIWRDATAHESGEATGEAAREANGASALAEYVRRAITSLEVQAGAQLLAGSVSFPAAGVPEGT
jgi:cytochrome b pre-mRNA-processing protein 3